MHFGQHFKSKFNFKLYLEVQFFESQNFCQKSQNPTVKFLGNDTRILIKYIVSFMLTSKVELKAAYICHFTELRLPREEVDNDRKRSNDEAFGRSPEIRTEENAKMSSNTLQSNQSTTATAIATNTPHRSMEEGSFSAQKQLKL